jgi:hypothetical protein
MIALSRKSKPSPTVTRHFEFTRFQDQLIALAYHAVVPVISSSLKRQRGRNQLPTIQHFHSKAGGA